LREFPFHSGEVQPHRQRPHWWVYKQGWVDTSGSIVHLQWALVIHYGLRLHGPAPIQPCGLRLSVNWFVSDIQSQVKEHTGKPREMYHNVCSRYSYEWSASPFLGK